MTLQQRYHQQLKQGQMTADPAQVIAVDALQLIHDELIEQQEARDGRSLLGRLFNRSQRPALTSGLYLWGGVGRGKTWLVDLFYNHLPLEQKQRLHFLHFMHGIHQQLIALKGEPDPLKRVAAEIASDTRVLCLDEFIVTDIGDAMILARVLENLFACGVTLITTSNTEPDNLYKDGLQRTSFLPAIALLKRHTRVMHLNSPTDYRLRYLEQATIYHTPHGPEVEELLEEEFERLAPEMGERNRLLHIARRDIHARRVADDAVWFDFMALCGPPRSQNDYLELASRYHTVIVSDIPHLGPSLDDVARRFIYLIDEFYDRNVKLIISAAAQPERLYQGERLAFDYQRTISRLKEMQSTAYLGKAHKA